MRKCITVSLDVENIKVARANAKKSKMKFSAYVDQLFTENRGTVYKTVEMTRIK